ncbi:Glutamyl-tRNA amidotransferase subunit A, mitochondrial [Apodospora peruviana]|uniref:Glutamyl-tRNA(Gln) amidotransferase subunit A, mitochondrial n=1 Tax=Apodospora peruviana TaxID=516989 RepID=A0AAE0HS35_9PEZI|nr:Glutamyl-tRNA amidotransferase subunit A, mitochondrial [Apodospora peruviana]KAK3330884.1 Glutamyl-tRNA amidotransferase subunit A, mitochondrial [Apodospora peruviana]
MSARAGLLRGLSLCHVSSTSENVSQRRRLLHHFISKVSPSVITEENNRLGQDAFTLAVKDNIATAAAMDDSFSLQTTCASSFLMGYRSPFEATIVTQLRARGAVVVGKTNLDEFGMGSHSTYSTFGAVAQEQDNKGDDIGSGVVVLRHSAGGSSGGSAVAVAVGDADVALGTDTGGSVRLPAAYTGVVGFKPSYGMLSRHGVVPYANSLDTVGLLARSVYAVTRLVIVSGLWAEHDPKDPTSLSAAARKRCSAGREGYHYNQDDKTSSTEGMLKGIKFGLPLEYNIEELDPRIRDAWAAAASVLQSLGARIVPVSLPSTRHALSTYYVIAPAEASSNLAKYDGVRYGFRASEDSAAATAATTAAAERDGNIPLPGAEEENKSDSGGRSNHVLYSATRGQGFGREVKRRILLGSYTLSSEAMDNYFIQAQKVRRVVRRDFDRAFRLPNPLLGETEEEQQQQFDLSDLPESIPMEDKFGPTQVDFLLCPTAPTLAPLLDDVLDQEKDVTKAYMNDVFTVPASLAGLPAVSIPVEVEAAAAPGGGGFVGLQLIGQYWDDARLLKVAGAVSECLTMNTKKKS